MDEILGNQEADKQDALGKPETLNQLTLLDVLKLRATNRILKLYCDQYLLSELDIKQIACGGSHSIILLKSRVFVMGDNTYGQIGLGEGIKKVPTPTEIPGMNKHKIKSVEAEEWHTVLLTENHEIIVFGNNDHGKLGLDEEIKDQFYPQKIEGIENAKSISVSYSATVILLHEDNKIKFFGCSDDIKAHILNDQIKLLPAWLDIAEISKTIEIKDISCKRNHVLILGKDNKIYGFKNNEYYSDDNSDEYHEKEWRSLLGLEAKITYFDGMNLLDGAQAKAVKATHINSLVVTDENKLIVSGLFEKDRISLFQPVAHLDTVEVNAVAANDTHAFILTSQNELLCMKKPTQALCSVGFFKLKHQLRCEQISSQHHQSIDHENKTINLLS